MFHFYKNLFMMTVKSSFSETVSASPEQNLLVEDTDIQNKLQDIADIFDWVEDKDLLWNDGVTKADIMKKWLWTDPSKLDWGLVDKQIQELYDTMKKNWADQSDLKFGVVSLLDWMATEMNASTYNPVIGDKMDDKTFDNSLNRREEKIKSLDDVIASDFIAEQGEKIPGLNEDNQELETENIAHQETITGLSEDNQELTAENTTYKETITGLSEDNQELTAENTTYKETITGLNEDNQELTAENTAHEATIDQLEREALQKQQQAKQLAQETEAKEAYQRKFQAAKDFYTNFNVTKEDMTFMQKTLIANGYDLPKYWADWGFWKETFNAVIKLQADNNLVQDGKMGNLTFAAVNIQQIDKADIEEEKEQIIASEEPSTLDKIADVSSEAFDNLTRESWKVYDDVVEGAWEIYDDVAEISC